MSQIDIDATLTLLRHGNQLKRTPRTGWVMRGVPQAENVAAHSYGVAFTALVLAGLLEEAFDNGRLLALAILHDLPEGITTDIPAPVWRSLPEGIKQTAEQNAFDAIFSHHPELNATLQPLWAELQANETPEAQLVHDADKLEMYLQAWQYQQQFGNRQLGEFWATPPTFHFAALQPLYDRLKEQAHA